MVEMRQSADTKDVSNVTLLHSALERRVPKKRRSMVIGEALRNAGAIEVPAADNDFREFVVGPLRYATLELLGEEESERLTDALLSELPEPAPKKRRAGMPSEPVYASMPPSKARKPSRPSWVSGTMDYADDPNLGYGKPVDVVVVDPDEVFRNTLRGQLEKLGYTVTAPHDPSAVLGFCQQHPTGVVAANVDLGAFDGFALAEELLDDLGEEAPEVLLFSDKAQLPAARDGVAGVVAKVLDSAFIETITRLMSGGDGS